MRNYSRQSKSFTERRRRRAIVGIVSAVLAIASWLFVFSRLSYLPALAISEINIYGTEAELVPVLSAAALRALDGAYGGLFSRANAFIYPEDSVSLAVASTSPRVDRVRVKRTGLRTLSVSVTEKTPAAVICADLPDDFTANSSTVPGRCHLADSAGFIFRPARESELGTGNKFYIPDLAGRELSGTFATSTEKFRVLQSLLNAVRNSGINVHAALVKGGDLEIYADNPGGGSIVVIKMNDRVPFDLQKDNLIAFWSKMAADARANRTKLEWSEIKLQYPPNVYSRPVESNPEGN